MLTRNSIRFLTRNSALHPLVAFAAILWPRSSILAVVAFLAGTLTADAVIVIFLTLACLTRWAVKPCAKRWEQFNADRHRKQQEKAARKLAKREEQRLAKQPKPPTKEELVEGLNAELHERLRIIDLALIPDEDKTALRNNELSSFEAKFHQLLGERS